MPPPADLDRLSHADLKSLVSCWKRWRSCGATRRDCAAQRRPGPAEYQTQRDGQADPKPAPASGSEPRPKGDKTAKLSINEVRTVRVTAPPDGSRFKGYTSFIVQDLVIRPLVVDFQRERWQQPNGEILTAPLPAGINGHFGPELRRFVLVQYHQGQVTVPRLLALLLAVGIFISKRQLVRLLIAGQDGFLAEAPDVLRAGLSTAAWLTG